MSDQPKEKKSMSTAMFVIVSILSCLCLLFTAQKMNLPVAQIFLATQ